MCLDLGNQTIPGVTASFFEGLSDPWGTIYFVRETTRLTGLELGHGCELECEL